MEDVDVEPELEEFFPSTSSFCWLEVLVELCMSELQEGRFSQGSWFMMGWMTGE